MADGHDVFNAKIKADTSQFSSAFGKIIAQMSGFGRLAGSIGTHAAGMAHVITTAMGGAEKATHGAGHAAHGAGKAIAGAGHAAEKAGPHIAHAAHPRAWMALAAHANLFKSHLGGIRAGVGEIGHSITEFLPALGAIAVGGGLVGLFELTEKVAEGFSEANKAAISAGLTGKEYARLALAAKMTDVPVEAMGASMFKLNKIIAEAALGGNKKAAAAFAHIGVALRDTHGHLVSAATIMPELAEAFKNTVDPAMRSRAAMALFGKAGAEMMPLLMEGKEGLEEFAKESDRLRYPFTPADKAGLEAYHRATISLGVAMSGFTNEIGAKLAPVLQPVIEMATEWVVANRDWIATGITNKVGELAEWIKELIPHLRGIIQSSKDWIESTIELGGHVGGLGAVIGALTLAIGSPLLVAVSSAISIFGNLAGALRAVSVLVWANPILLAIGAVAFAATELLRAWDPMKGFWENLWAGITLAFTDAWTVIKPIINAFNSGAEWLGSTALGQALHFNVNHDWNGDQPPGTTPGPWGQPVPSAMPQIYGPSATGATASGPQASRDGTVKTEIIIRGLPSGSTVATSATGAVSQPDVDVGYALAGIVGGF
jgi:hypothetical protein